MSKINTITLSNFKFFGKEEIINIDGKHLLLYGENGSGKSSLFWGIYTLLEASMKKSTDIAKYFKPYQNSSESLVNIHASQMSCVRTHTEHSNSYIQINTTDNVYVVVCPYRNRVKPLILLTINLYLNFRTLKIVNRLICMKFLSIIF